MPGCLGHNAIGKQTLRVKSRLGVAASCQRNVTRD